MAKVFLISPQYVKDNTVIDENIDDKYINVAIQEAQLIKLKYLIGSGFYNEIISQKIAGTLTGSNLTFVETYVAPYLLYQTVVQLIPYTLYKHSNRNTGTKQSELTTPVDNSIMEKIMKDAESNAQVKAKELRDYLDENDTLFPTYVNQGTGIDVILPQAEVFTSAIFTGNVNDRGSHCRNNIGGCDTIRINL